MKKLKKLLFFDIDHTISTFSHEAGMSELRSLIASPALETHALGEHQSKIICALFDKFFSGFMDMGQGRSSQEIDSLKELIVENSKEVPNSEVFDSLYWSRELWVHIAAKPLRFAYSPSFAVRAAESYWQGVSSHTEIYPDVKAFFAWLGIYYQDWKIVFVSSSDARLYEREGKLTYDPEYSSAKKLKRLMHLLRLPHITVVLGDPVGKPHPDFWQKVFEKVGYNPENDVGIMVGDSYKIDICGISQFGLVPVLIDREGKTDPRSVPEAESVIHSFQQLQAILNAAIQNHKNMMAC